MAKKVSPKSSKKKVVPESSEHTGTSSLGAHEQYCSGCASKIYKEAPLCPKCGFTTSKHHTHSKNRIAAALLALFFGGLGIHKFYMGRKNEGLLYLGGMIGGIVFFWLVIPIIFIVIVSFAALYDFFYLLCISDAKFQTMCIEHE